MVTNIPGTEELFTVEKYKKELAKPYSKLDLYLCRISDFSIGNSGPISNLNKAESATSATPAIANSTLYIHEGKPEETSLSELDAYLNQNDIINVSENVSLNTQPLQHFPGFWDENSGFASRDQTLDSVPGRSGHNSMDRKKCKISCPICNRKFPVSAINEHADACLDRQTTPTTICITSEDEGENLEENDLQIISHNSLSRNDIAAIISSAANNDCRVINDFSIKLNIHFKLVSILKIL